MPTALSEWERAEVERSHQQALRVSAFWLPRTRDREIARYLNPPLDSPFPLEHAFALLGDLRGLSVLDLGCGTGENSLLLAKRGARVIGVDISASLIELARRRLEVNGVSFAAEFVVGSAHDLPIPTESIDLVVGIAVLHHLNLDITSREVFRILKNGGRAVFQEPVRNSRLLRAVRRVIPYRTPDVSPFERPLTLSEVRSFAARFKTDSIRAFSLPFVNVASVVPRLNRHIATIYRADAALLRWLPQLAGFAGIRVIALSKSTVAAAADRVDEESNAMTHATATF